MEESERGELETLARRLDFVEALADGPLHKRDLVDELQYSRSTVDRAVDELEDAGFVERVSRGYVTTQTGRLAAQRYREFVTDFDTQLAAADIVDAVPHDHDLPAALFEDATVEGVDGPYELFTRVSDIVGVADVCRIVLPNLFDSRHVQVWHSQVVRGDRTVELFTDESVLDQLDAEFPQLTNELADTDGFRAHEISTPPFGLVVPASQTDRETPPVLLITYEDDEIAGVIETTSAAAQDWARERFEQYRTSGEAATERLWTGDRDAGLGLVPGTGLSPSLESEGFEVVDEQFFEEREPIPPETGWQAGLGLPEVADGQSADRTLDDGESLREQILTTLADGTDVAVLGPGGSGKSTLCKQAACAWARERDGQLIYRESGQGRPFSSVRLLEDHLRDADEQVLVVVEDAIRSEANEMFAVMHRLAGRDDIVFLLDAREAAWHDTDSSLDTRLEAFRHSALEVLSMPALDETDCRALMQTAESLLDGTIEMDPSDLLADIWGDTTSESGSMVLLIHKLAHLADPLSEQPETTGTALDDDVDRVRADLAGIGETAMDVGLLANTLNAANVELSPAFLYAVGLGRPDGIDQVEQALSRLEGQVLLSRATASAYSGPHELWSVRFLERYLSSVGTGQARERFERCLQTLFSLVDRPSQCAELAEIVDGETPSLDRIAVDRKQWAKAVIDSIFGFAAANGRLAPLFPTSEETTVSLPTVCSDETRAEVMKRRAELYILAGDYERARTELRHLDSLATASGLTTYRALASMKLGEVAKRTDEFDQAQQHCETALDIAAESETRKITAACFNKIGEIATEQSEYDRAQEYYERSLDIRREIGDRDGEAETLYNLGRLDRRRSAYEQAQQFLEASLERYRESGDREGEAESLHELSNIAGKRAEYERASEYVEKALATRREIGDRQGEAYSLRGLGDIAVNRSAYDRAQEYYEKSRTISQEIGDRDGEATCFHNLGLIARNRGEYDRAQEYYEQSLAINREIGNRNSEALTLLTLGTIAFVRGVYDQAREYYEESLETYREIGSPEREAYSLDGLGNVAFRRGEYDQARACYEESLAICREIGARKSESTSLKNLGEIAFHRGSYGQAREYYEESLAICRETDQRNSEAGTLNSLGVLARAEGSLDKAESFLDDALDIAREIGAVEQVVRSLRKLGTVERERGEYEQAAEYFETARNRCDDDEHRKERARIQFEQARLALCRDNVESARDRLDAAVDVFTEMAAPRDSARATLLEGKIASAADAPDSARESYEAALDTFTEIGAPQDQLRTLQCLVDTCRAVGDEEQVNAYLETAQSMLETAPDPVRAQYDDWVDREATE